MAGCAANSASRENHTLAAVSLCHHRITKWLLVRSIKTYFDAEFHRSTHARSTVPRSTTLASLQTSTNKPNARRSTSFLFLVVLQ